MQDEDIINEFGLEDFDKEEQDKLIKEIGENLKLRVGMKFAEILSEDQLEQFQDVMDKDNETDAAQWLSANIPNYAEVVAEEMRLLKSEIHKSVKEIEEKE